MESYMLLCQGSLNSPQCAEQLLIDRPPVGAEDVKRKGG